MCLDELLDKYVDVVFANEDEARAHCGSNDPQVALGYPRRTLSRGGCQTRSRRCLVARRERGLRGLVPTACRPSIRREQGTFGLPGFCMAG